MKKRRLPRSIRELTAIGRMNVMVCAVLAAALLCSCRKQTQTDETDHVSLVLNWTANGTHAAYYAAVEYGYYRAEHLDVSIREGSGSETTVQVVAAGRQEFGLADGGSIVIGRSKGIPVVALAAIYQKNPTCLIALTKSGITKPQDLIGRTMGVRFGSSTYPFYDAMTKLLGIDRKRIHEVSIGPGMEPLLLGQVDATDGHIDNEAVQVRERGLAINVIPYSSLGLNTYGICLVTSDNVLKSKPDVVARFVRASIKGWQLAVSDPVKAAAAVTKANPSLKADIVVAQTRASLELVNIGDAAKYGLGWQTKEGWQTTIDTMQRTGQLSNSPVPESLFTQKPLQDKSGAAPKL